MNKITDKKTIWLLPVFMVMFMGQSCTEEIPEVLEKENTSIINQTSEHEYVDLGLSVCWATCNIGASNPFELGKMLSWGELADKPSYRYWDYYKWYSGNGFSKYNSLSGYGNDGFVDEKTILEPYDDVAHVLWGDDWRMPTRAEFDELINNCTWELIAFGNVSGYYITSCVPGYTDRSIFLPAAGGNWGESRGISSDGFYWSSEASDCPSKSWNLNFGINKYSIGDEARKTGQSVRPVKPLPHDDVITLSISRNELCLEEGKEDSLYAIVRQNYEKLDADVRWSSSNNNVAVVSASGRIRAISSGVCTITAVSGSAVAECRVNVISSQAAPQMIDLGLSVKWATFNVGADSPEKVGYYFAWGETESKPLYNWVLYKHCSGPFSTSTTKYCDNTDWGTRDDRFVLEAEDDAATAMWGDGWRTPTPRELNELIENCTWTWTNYKGMDGYKVTSNIQGYTDRSIFLPAAGICGIDCQMGVGKFGHYWTSSILDAGWVAAWKLLFHKGDKKSLVENRFYGCPIRPVYDEPVQTPVPELVDLGLSVNWASFNLGASTPGEYGDYLSWGEINEKETYTTYSYRYNRDEFLEMIENDNISGTQYDAAHVRLDGDWRMPTKEECQELVDNCTWSWEQSEEGTYGMKVTGPNGNSIFLPAGGYPNPSWIDVGTYGTYWTSSKSTYRSSITMGSNTSYYFRFNQNMKEVLMSASWCVQCVRKYL